jgi:hypothetical protein
MPVQVSQFEVGTIYNLDEVSSAGLEELGEELLVDSDGGYRCIGIEPKGPVYPRLLEKILSLDLVGQVRDVLASEEWVTFMGVEIIGNQTMSVNYTRPLSDDAPREDNKRLLLNRAVQAQLPLTDNVLVGAHESDRHAVEPGQVFIPRLGSHYAVMIPSNGVNMEVILARDFQATRQDWENYLDAQPHPIS